MTADSELREKVERELEWEPSVDERRIGVSVSALDGIVTLTGEVPSYGEKWKAERTVERVAGVRGIVNELEVHPPTERSDTDIAKAAVDALRWDAMVPSDQITVEVEKGWLRLKGTVSSDYERRAAERAVRNLAGVKGISNLITAKPRVEPHDLKQRIEEALRRAAAYDASQVTVEVSGSEVTLRGSVRSWAERHEAEKAASAAAGVTQIHDFITVTPLDGGRLNEGLSRVARLGGVGRPRMGTEVEAPGMDSDSKVRRRVEQELEWEPSVDYHLIGVSVDDGVVTLRGDVWYYAQKWKAQRAVERVKGVRGVVNQLSVRSPDDITDQDIAEAAVEALRWNVMVPSDRIKVRVEKGWLTLEGAVRWDFQRRAAERAVRYGRGLRGISNLIVVKPQVEPTAITERITEALEREAIDDARRVLVEVTGPEVTLRGVVRSWAERHEAEKVAWAAPGVSEVHNLLTVDSLAEPAA